ncbi:MAG: AtpZ/AtpI family protein [Candidatus Sumerlaeia bacterium]|nr:AtpZ/AtpI family protein [Candidatus Sumerlaeia bacterium]
MADDDPIERSGQTVGSGALALMLPITMASSPIVGYFLGAWIGDAVGWEGLRFVGLILGLAAGIRESAAIIKRLNSRSARR